MYNMRPSLFCCGVKGNLKLRWSLQVPTCISVIVSVVGGVKGTKNALSFEVPPPIRNVH